MHFFYSSFFFLKTFLFLVKVDRCASALYTRTSSSLRYLANKTVFLFYFLQCKLLNYKATTVYKSTFFLFFDIRKYTSQFTHLRIISWFDNNFRTFIFSSIINPNFLLIFSESVFDLISEDYQLRGLLFYLFYLKSYAIINLNEHFRDIANKIYNMGK